MLDKSLARVAAKKITDTPPPIRMKPLLFGATPTSENAYHGKTSPIALLTVLMILSNPCFSQSLGEAVGAPDLVWSTGGNQDWYATVEDGEIGATTARSGSLLDDQASWIETTVGGPGMVRFMAKVSSEENYDFLVVTLNGVEVTRYSGESGWRESSHELPDGPTTLRWTYFKDESVSEGEDTAFLAQVTYVPDAPLTLLASPTMQIRKAPSGLELLVRTTEDGGALGLYGATDLLALSNSPTLLDVFPMGSWDEIQLPVTQTEPTYFFMGKLMPQEMWEFSDHADEVESPQPPYVLWTAGLPESLVSGQSHTVDFILSSSNLEGGLYNGTATLSLIRTSDGTQHPDAIISPSGLTFLDGVARVTLSVTAETDLEGYRFRVSLTQPGAAEGQSITRLPRSGSTGVTASINLPTAAPAASQARQAAEEAIAARVDTLTWSHPLDSTTRLSGVFGEWRGHKRLGMPNANVHLGLDFAAAAGTAVKATRGGFVSHTGNSDGRFIVVDHYDGTYSRYLHLAPDAAGLETSDPVVRGQTIGHVGSAVQTGLAAHLHYELRRGIRSGIPGSWPGAPVDPLQASGSFAVRAAAEEAALRMVGITRPSPAVTAYRVPTSPAAGVGSSTVHVVLQAVHLENGSRLAPRSLEFIPEGPTPATVLSAPDSNSLSRLMPASEPSNMGLAKYEHGELNAANTGHFYRYWFAWDTGAFLNDPVGPRSFEVVMETYDGSPNTESLKWGPEIVSIDPVGTPQQGKQEYLVRVRAWLGETLSAAPTSQNLPAWETGSDWLRFELPPGGSWSRTEPGITVYEEDRPGDGRMRGIREATFFWPVDVPPEKVVVRSRTVPSISHEMEFGLPTWVMEIRYSWRAPQEDLDTSTTFLDSTVGWSCGESGNYMNWSGDDTSEGGEELVVIRLGEAATEGDLPPGTSEIQCRAGWHQGLSSGMATLSVRLLQSEDGEVLQERQKQILPGSQADCAQTPVGTIALHYDPGTGSLLWELN